MRAARLPSAGQAVTTANGTASAGPPASKRMYGSAHGWLAQHKAKRDTSYEGLGPEIMQRQFQRHRVIVADLPHPADFAIEQQTKEKDRMADPEDRTQDDRVRGFDQEVDDKAPGPAECAALLRRQQHVEGAGDFRREPHHEHPRQQCATDIGAHDGRGIITQHERGRRQHEQADPRRRADEHQDGKYQLIAADRPEVREQKKPPILHIALTPAQVSAHELQQCRRICLPPKIFPRYHAHVVAGSPHQSRFDLVVTEDMPLLLAVSGQHWQLAMLDERFEPQDGVVPPIRTAIGLPPRASNRVGAHAEPHAELKDAGEQAR